MRHPALSFNFLTFSVLPRAMLELAPTELRGPNEGGMSIVMSCCHLKLSRHNVYICIHIYIYVYINNCIYI